MNKFFSFSIAILLLLGFIGWFTALSPDLTMYAGNLITVAENLGIIMMLVNGTFIRSRLFKIAQFFIGLVILGFLFKILHLPGADQLLLYPFIALWMVYFIHFLKKKDKKALDILKVLMLFGFLVLPTLFMLHLDSAQIGEMVILANRVLFWITFLYFVYNGYKHKLFFRQ